MSRLQAAAAGVVAAALGVAGLVSGFALDNQGGPGVTTTIAAGLEAPAVLEQEGRFDVGCNFSHSLPDDPIVAPGAPGFSHMHDFFGFKRTNAFTTFDEQIAALDEDPIPTTCTERARQGGSPPARNASGYWTPAVYVQAEGSDTPVKIDPSHAHIYYRTGGLAKVEHFAPGMVMIAGNPAAPPEEQRGRFTWFCGALNDPTFDHIPPDCADHDSIKLFISFPTCWNGELDSFDHRSHVPYKEDHGGRCPRSHPLHLTRIVMQIVYPVRRYLGRRLNPATDRFFLASGAMTTAHADYKFGWDQARIDRLVDECINAGVDCKKNPPA